MKCFVFILVVLTHQVQAQLNWQELTDEQQKLLLPFASDWNSMEVQARDKLITNTNKWLEMSPEEKALSHQKLNRFKNLPPEQQHKLKQRAQQYKRLAPAQKRQLKEAHKRFKQLSPEQKRKVRRKYGQLSPKQQLHEIDKFKNNRKKLEFVNEFDIEKRRPIITMFKSFNETTRKKLKRHLMQLPATKRHALTLKLLEMSLPNRQRHIERI